MHYKNYIIFLNFAFSCSSYTHRKDRDKNKKAKDIKINDTFYSFLRAQEEIASLNLGLKISFKFY